MLIKSIFFAKHVEECSFSVLRKHPRHSFPSSSLPVISHVACGWAGQSAGNHQPGLHTQSDNFVAEPLTTDKLKLLGDLLLYCHKGRN